MRTALTVVRTSFLLSALVCLAPAWSQDSASSNAETDASAVSDEAVEGNDESVDPETVAEELNAAGRSGGATQFSVEQLEQQLAEQKEALEKAEQNLADIKAREAEVQDKLDASAAERVATESEIRKLCKEQEELSPGSFDSCIDQ